MFNRTELISKEPAGDFPSRSRNMIVQLAQELLAGRVKLSEIENRLPSPDRPDDLRLGLSQSQFSLIEQTAERLGAEVALVGHRSPDFDCLASCAIAAFLLKKTGRSSRIFVDGGRVDQISRRLEGFQNYFRIESLDHLPKNLPIVLLDALDSGAPHVNVPGGRVPDLVIDTHHGQSNGARVCVSENHAAATTILLAELFQHFPPGHAVYQEVNVRRMMTFAFLGIMTDTAELRRATPYEIEAVRLIIPCLEQEILERFQRSPFNRDTRSIVALIESLEAGRIPAGTQLRYRHQNDFLFCYLGPLREEFHDPVAAAADEWTFRHQGISPALVLLVYYSREKKRLVASARLDLYDEISARIDLPVIMRELFADSGTRGSNVGGGTSVPTLSPTALIGSMEEKFFETAAFIRLNARRTTA